MCSNYWHGGMNEKPCLLSVQDCFPAVPRTCYRGQDATCSTAYSTSQVFQGWCYVVARFLIHDTRVPENMMEWGGGLLPLFSQNAGIVASTLVLGQKRCHSRNEFYCSPAYVPLSEVTNAILKYCIKKILPVPFESCSQFNHDLSSWSPQWNVSV